MPSRLSARQEQCIRLTAFRTDKEIAAHLGISEATVKKHVHEACQRLGVNRRKAALAILDQNVPGYPNDPIAPPAADAVDGDSDARGEEGDNGRENGGLAALDLGRSGKRPGSPGRGGAESPGAGASDERASIGRRARVAGGAAADAAVHGGSGLAIARFGYSPAPRGPFVRFLLIACLTIVIAAMLMTLTTMISDFSGNVRKIDQAGTFS